MAALEAKGMAINEAERNRTLLYSADVNLAFQVWHSDDGNRAYQCRRLLLVSRAGPRHADLCASSVGVTSGGCCTRIRSCAYPSSLAWPVLPPATGS